MWLVLYLGIKLWFWCYWVGNGHGFRFHKVEPMLGERATHGKPTHCFWGLFLFACWTKNLHKILCGKYYVKAWTLMC